MRTIGVVTTSRADYGIFRPVLRAIASHPELALELYVGGTHLVSHHGKTVSEIERDGFPIAERVEGLMASDSAQAVSKAIGVGCVSWAQVFSSRRPDILLILGDRYEMFAAACAALPFNIPLAHIHGGEVTQGAIDEVLRHALTKMSHLHFVATTRYGQRVVQMGEEPWRVVVSGAPSLDNLDQVELAPRAEIEAFLGGPLGDEILAVTYHPVTRAWEGSEAQIRALLTALQRWEGSIVFTQSNADTANDVIMERVRAFVEQRKRAHLVASLGTRRYFGLLSIAAAMVGNSSSGIIEAASFELPVVDIGTRQRGRDHAHNVLHVEADAVQIARAIERATSEPFRGSLRGMKNPYGDGTAGDVIAQRLAEVSLNDDLVSKRFYDVSGAAQIELPTGE